MTGSVSTSPLSSASAASRAISRHPDLEPDDEWKENLKAQIQLNLNSMVEDAESQLTENLRRNPADSDRLQKELAAAMDNIRKLATETFKAELDRERHERRWATGHELPPDLAENMKKEQQAILDQIQSGKSSNPSSSDGPAPNSSRETSGPPNSFYRNSSTSEQSTVSLNINVSPPNRSKATLPEPGPSSEEDTDNESDTAYTRRLKSQPIVLPPKSRDDDTRSSWESNSNPAPRLYPSSTTPELWIPPKSTEESVASSRPQRRGSTASIRSTGSASASSRRPPDTIPEAPSNDNPDLAARAEQERMRIQDADQAWRNLDAAKGKAVRRRPTLDSMKGPSSSNSPAPTNDHHGTSPGVSMVSSSPSQPRRPPTPPLNTKPIYRKSSFTQDSSSHESLHRKASIIQERTFDKVAIPPRPTQSHLSMSRPTEPFSGSGDSPFAQPPMSATLAFAQAAEGYHPAHSYATSTSPSHAPDFDMRTRSRHPSNESRYPNPPASAGPAPSGDYSYPSFHTNPSQAYPSHRNTYSSPSSARPSQHQPPYSASPYPNPQSSTSYAYMSRAPDETDYFNGPPQRLWSGTGSTAVPGHDSHQPHMRPPVGSHDWRLWSQSQTQNLRSPMSNNNLREQHQYQAPERYQAAPTYANHLVDQPEEFEEDSDVTTESESEEPSVTHRLKSSSSYSSIPYSSLRANSRPEAKRVPMDEESLEYQQMMAQRRKALRFAAEEAKAIAAEDIRKKEASKQAAEEEIRKEIARQTAEEETRRREVAEEAKRKKLEEEAKKQEENAKKEAKAREAKEREAEARRKKDEEVRTKKEMKRQREEERLRVEERRKEDAKRKEEEEARRKEAEVRRQRILEEEARLEQAKEEARKEDARREELRREEAEIRRREDEARKREDEIRRKEEEFQRKLLEDKQKEFKRLKEEAHKKEKEAKVREQQARLREEEARKREAEIQERERQLRQAEEELKRREQAAQERREREEAQREKLAEELRLRQEQEKLEQEERRREERDRFEREERQREEQARIVREERLREEQAAAEAFLLQQKVAQEEQERLENEIAWRELEKRKAGAARREEQAATSRKKPEDERKQNEGELKRKEKDRQNQEEERKRAETEKMAQQEEFRRREEEIKNRKRQDTAGWENWTMPTPGTASWGTGQQPFPSSNAPFSGASGVNTPPRSNATSFSSWSTKSQSAASSSNSTWSTASKTSTTSTSASASANRSSNPSSTTPTPKPRSGSTGAAGSTPSPASPISEEEWQRRNEEQYRAQQERFRKEQERIERNRMANSTKVKGKEEVIKTFEHHARLWEKLPEYPELRWDIFPWPMLNKPSSPEDITYTAISAYVLSPYYPEKEKPQKDRIKEQIRRWHPDRFDTKLLTKVVEEDKERVKEGAGSVVRSLNNLLTKSNTPSFFD